MTINAETLNYWWTPPILNQEDRALNGFWIMNSKIYVREHEDQPILDLDSFNIPRRNWGWFLWHYNRWRNIKLTIAIKWDDQADFYTEYQTLMTYLNIQNVKLDVKVLWEFRRIVCNLVWLPIKKNHYNINFIDLEINFKSLEPFWYLVDRQTDSFLSKTSDLNVSITNNWSVVSDAKIYLTFNSASWVSSIQITNWTQTITLSESITTSDVIIIDWELKKVTKNWNNIDFTWTFLDFQPGSNPFLTTLNWTYNVDYTVLHKVNYNNI